MQVFFGIENVDEQIRGKKWRDKIMNDE